MNEVMLACKSLVKAVHTEIASMNKTPTDRLLADIINKNTREIYNQCSDPLVREEMIKTLKGFGKLIVREPIMYHLISKPTLDYYVEGQKCDLLHFGQESFTIFGLCFDGENTSCSRKEVIQKLSTQARMIASSTGKDPDKLVIVNPTLPKLSIIAVERATDLANKNNDYDESTELSEDYEQHVSSVIVLDVEGQYAERIEKLNVILAAHGIATSSLPSIDLAHITNNSCLTLSELDIETHIPNFVPDLSVKSQEQFKLALHNTKQRNPPSNFRELFIQLGFEIENNQIIQYQIKKALGRSVVSLKRIAETLFDIPDKSLLTADRLLEPGKITIVDVSDLDEDYRRHVAIYLMSLLHRHKILLKESGRTVLVADEAHKLFPKKLPSTEKDYFERIYQFIRDINHRGRKRQLSVLIATQHPTDVADDILALCDTKIIFEVDAKKWVHEQIGDKPLPSGKGQAYIICNDTRMSPLRINTYDVMGLIKGKVSLDNIQDENRHCGKGIGYIIQRDKYPLKYKLNGAELCGYSPAPDSAFVAPGMIVVVNGERDNISSKLYCEVRDIYKAFEKRSYSSDFDRTQFRDRYSEEYQTHLKLSPLREVSSDGYDGPLRNFNYTNWPILLPTEAELRKCLNIPEKGLPIGKAVISEQASQTLSFFYPYHPLSYERNEAEWLIDHSAIIVGSQGRGKTSILLLIAYLLASPKPEHIGTEIAKLCSNHIVAYAQH